MFAFFKKILSKIIYPNTYSSEAYVKFLKKKGVKIGQGTRFVSPKQTSIDIARAKYISIGKNCCFSRGAIFAHDYSWYTLIEKYNEILPDPGGKVTIGDNVFIGFESVIMPNVTIGDNVIVGARSIVTKDIPSDTVWLGTPAKQICSLKEFRDKRKENEMISAKIRVDFLKENSELSIENLGYFAFYFLERTEENYNKYIKKLEYNGLVDSKKIKEIFFSHQPFFNSFDDFLNCLEGIKYE